MTRDVPASPALPTARNVSAALRAAGFSAYRDGRDEGYLVEWHGMPGSSPVRVGFEAVTREIYELAFREMTVVFQRRGWDVRDTGRYLIVKERQR